MQAFREIMRAWRGDSRVDDAAAVLRISSRTLRYMLDGTTLPTGATLALIESEVARGAGVTIADVRRAVLEDRRARLHGGDGASDATGAIVTNPAAVRP